MKKHSWIAAILSLAIGCGAYAADYYVRTDGNDANPGTGDSASGAFKTIARANAVAGCGDTIHIGAGTFIEGQLVVSNACPEGNPKRFAGSGYAATTWVVGAVDVDDTACTYEGGIYKCPQPAATGTSNSPASCLLQRYTQAVYFEDENGVKGDMVGPVCLTRNSNGASDVLGKEGNYFEDGSFYYVRPWDDRDPRQPGGSGTDLLAAVSGCTTNDSIALRLSGKNLALQEVTVITPCSIAVGIPAGAEQITLEQLRVFGGTIWAYAGASRINYRHLKVKNTMRRPNNSGSAVGTVWDATNQCMATSASTFTMEDIETYACREGFSLSNGANNGTIDGLFVHGSFNHGIKIQDTTTHDIVIRDALTYNNQEPLFIECPYNIRIENSTFPFNVPGGCVLIQGNPGGCPADRPRGISFYNNIIDCLLWHNYGGDTWAKGGHKLDYNTYVSDNGRGFVVRNVAADRSMSLSAWQSWGADPCPDCLRDPHSQSFTRAQIFVSYLAQDDRLTASYDFDMRPDSPAAGTASPAWGDGVDIEGVNRSTPRDPGAYDHSEGGNPPCAPMTCAQLGYNCGTANDGCGGTLNCGSCSSHTDPALDPGSSEVSVSGGCQAKDPSFILFILLVFWGLWVRLQTAPDLMKEILNKKLFFVLAVLLTGAVANATDYYVGPGGSDSRDGRSPVNAWGSVAKCASALNPGDRCYIQPGTYYVSAPIVAARGGNLRSNNLRSDCTCNKKSREINCGGTISGVAAGQFVRCDSGYGFSWSEVAAVSGSKITLAEDYRGASSPTAGADTLDVADFIQYLGTGAGPNEVVLSSFQDRPLAEIVWQSESSWPCVWSYQKNKAPAGSPWQAPSGFREATPLDQWDLWYGSQTGGDPYPKMSTGCPCGKSTVKEQVDRIPGSWGDDGTSIFLQTRGCADPNASPVQASGLPLNKALLDVGEKPYLILNNLTAETAYPANGIGQDADVAVFSFRLGADEVRYSNLVSRGGKIQFGMVEPAQAHAYRNMLYENIRSLTGQYFRDGDVSHSGLRFDNVEFRGGYSNNVSLNFLQGASAEDPVILNRIYLHRTYTWYRPTNSAYCSNTGSYNCDLKTWEGEGNLLAAAHGAYIGTSAADRQVNHVVLQNSIVEITGDGWSFFNGNGATDVTFRNNTFGFSGSQLANANNEIAIIGFNSGSGYGAKFYNNIFYCDDSTATGNRCETSIRVHGGDFSQLISDYNLFLRPYLTGNAAENNVIWSVYMGASGTSPATLGRAIRDFNQEKNSLYVCYGGCSSSEPSAHVYNDGAASRQYFIKGDTRDKTASNYTPVEGKSRAIDAGAPGLPGDPGGTLPCPAEDFYGRPRLTRCDIGAVEYQGPCVPTSCSAQGKNCGTINDGCGGTLNCGSCTAPQTCGGGGASNVCGNCLPKTCAQLGYNCGTASNGCGGTVNCGNCPSGQNCGGAGNNRCGSGVCTPKTCSQLSAECGLISDGCSQLLDCDGCPPPFSCGVGGQANRCGSTDPNLQIGAGELAVQVSSGCRLGGHAGPALCFLGLIALAVSRWYRRRANQGY